MEPTTTGLTEAFGPIDIYLFDQLLRGNITPDMRVLDAGCGGGRNLVFMLQGAFDVHAVDRDPAAVEAVRALARRLVPSLPESRFVVAEVGDLPYPEEHFDCVVSSAVLHFADDEDAFRAMVVEMWRVLRPGGLLFARLASTIGIEERVRPLGGRWYTLPDGTDRFLVDEDLLRAVTRELGAQQVDPIKTTNVENQRCMTTWVLRKHS